MKLDENLGDRGAEVLREAGNDVSTVRDQSLSGSTDHDLIQVCRREQRCLVTLDMDFANPLVFRPCDFSGIAVLRLPPRPTHEHLIAAIKTLAAHLPSVVVSRRLWIVEIDRIRIYQDEDFEIDQMFDDEST